MNELYAPLYVIKVRRGDGTNSFSAVTLNKLEYKRSSSHFPPLKLKKINQIPTIQNL